MNDAGTCKGEPECERRGRGRIKMTAETQPFKAAYAGCSPGPEVEARARMQPDELRALQHASDPTSHPQAGQMLCDCTGGKSPFFPSSALFL